MRALITGGGGFIGSHLAEKLLNQGDCVHIIDNFSTGQMENINHLRGQARFSYTVGSIMSEKTMEPLIEKADTIYHLAAAVGVKLIISEQIESLMTNIQGSEQILRLAHQKGNKKVIIASTSEIYGKNGSIPYREDADRLIGPTTKFRWSYSTTKAIDEYLALAYFKEKRLPIIIVRLFNTVGPRQIGRYGMVIPRFIKQALLGEPITVYGDGSQRRCFGYVEDVVEGIIALSRCSEAVGDIFNIGNTEEITIACLARKIKKLTKSASKIVYIPYEEAYEEGFEDMPYRMPDITKINKLVGYEPKVCLQEMLMKTIEYFQIHSETLKREKEILVRSQPLCITP